MTTPDQFLMSGGVTSAKFPAVGTTVTGTITTEPEVRQQTDIQTGTPKTWGDGSPRMQLVVILATSERDPEIPDDDGERAVYIKANMQKAVRDAVRKAGANGLAVGGTLSITYSGDGQAKGAGFNPPKLFTAAYQPPANAAANEFLNGNGQQATPNGQPDPWGQPQGAPPQFAQPAPQAVPQAVPAPAPMPVQPVAQAAPQAAAQQTPLTQAMAAEVGQIGNVTTQAPPPGVSAEAMAALQSLSPEQRAALGIPTQ
ncbi:hypothetical protein [Actinomadura rudentiformis]|uniref:hypothetical protein n=1 Tax=Actinomadura rudentiformis TaxID=359158 RepID=UPI00178C5875|nr:hypothetical protein [Actinomadura rudentiformis]